MAGPTVKSTRPQLASHLVSSVLHLRNIAIDMVAVPECGGQHGQSHRIDTVGRRYTAYARHLPARAGENCRLASARTIRVVHAAGFGLDAISPIEIRIDVDTCAADGAASVVRLERRECPARDDIRSRSRAGWQRLSDCYVPRCHRKQRRHKAEPSSPPASKHKAHAELRHCVTVRVTSMECVTPVPVPAAVT